MDKPVPRNVEDISTADSEIVPPAVSQQVQSDSRQMPEEAGERQQSTEQAVAESVNAWVDKAKKQRARLEKSYADGYAIALDVVAADSQRPQVKSAYLETLFGTMDTPRVSVYRTVGKCTLLHQESTKAVIGYLPIHVAIQFARMKVDVQRKVLDYFRAHPGEPPSKESLKAARRAGEMKQAKEIRQAKSTASKQQVDSDEARRLSSRNELACIASADNEPFDEWEQSKQEKAVAWLQKAQREAVTVGLKLELAEALMQRMQSSTVMQS
jgi:hypothetical protein